MLSVRHLKIIPRDTVAGKQIDAEADRSELLVQPNLIRDRINAVLCTIRTTTSDKIAQGQR